jgi:hypothetical protein
LIFLVAGQDLADELMDFVRAQHLEACVLLEDAVNSESWHAVGLDVEIRRVELVHVL